MVHIKMLMLILVLLEKRFGDRDIHLIYQHLVLQLTELLIVQVLKKLMILWVRTRTHIGDGKMVRKEILELEKFWNQYFQLAHYWKMESF